ncbi:MAG: hypothetical protein D6719_05330 [Candidatus Dadabacteria bacterium]|nr:MAG: hypothetical protein D6719_05330 [Candidatus Dadabacteria bacterium]
MKKKGVNCDVLIFSAHPDDAEMAMGGTLLKLARAGLKLHHVVLTHSEMSTHGDVKTREAEFKSACEFIGCQGEFLDFYDTQVENTPQARLKIARVIRQYRPAAVFAPYHTNNRGEPGGIANVDHYATGALVRDAVKIARLKKTVPELEPHTVKRLFFYMLPRDVLPRLYVNITDLIDDAMALVRCYKSQMKINFMGNDIEHILKTKKASFGIEVGAGYAEGFTTDLPLEITPELIIA